MYIKIDPDLKAQIPPLSDDEYNNLEQSILKEGCRDSLITWNGYLVDGHNRYEICQKHNIIFTTKEKQFDSKDDVCIWMIINQFGRRNLVPFVKAELVLKLEGLYQKKALENLNVANRSAFTRFENDLNDFVKSGCQNSDKVDLDSKNVKLNSEDTNKDIVDVDEVIETVLHDVEKVKFINKQLSLEVTPQKIGNDRFEKDENDRRNRLKEELDRYEYDRKLKYESVDTKKELAKIAGVSHDTIARVKKILDKAPEEIKQKARVGDISVNQAYKPIKVEEKKEINLKKSNETVKNAEIKPIIYNESAIDFLNRYEDSSIDLLLTDPPYITDVEDINEFIDSWLISAIKKVKPTGRAFIFIGAYPKEMSAYLSKLTEQDTLIFEDILVWTYKNTIGPTPKTSFVQNWQAILYLRGKYAPVWNTTQILDLLSVKEINAPDGRQGDRFYKWQKPKELIDLLVRISTKPGDIVIDCFAGSGTHLLSASSLDRKAFGCDLGDEPFKIACSLGCVAGDCIEV